MNLFEKRAAREKLEQEIRETRLGRAKDKRIEREFKQAQATNSVSFFLKKESQSNKDLRAALSQIDPSLQFSQQPSVEYKPTTNSANKTNQATRAADQKQNSIETILPPRPNDNKLYVLCVRDTELQWIETVDCE